MLISYAILAFIDNNIFDRRQPLARILNSMCCLQNGLNSRLEISAIINNNAQSYNFGFHGNKNNSRNTVYYAALIALMTINASADFIKDSLISENCKSAQSIN